MLQTEASSDLDVTANYLRAAHVQPDGRIISFDEEQQMWFSPRELRDYELRRGDVVVVEGGAGFGRSAFIRDDLQGWGFQNSIVRLRPFADRMNGRYLDYALQSALANATTALACSTATIPHFTAEKVAAFAVPVPLIAEQVAIADFLDRETAKIDALIDKASGLAETAVKRFQGLTSQVIGAPSDGSAWLPLGRLLRRIDQGWSPQCANWPVDNPHEDWSILKVGCVNGGVFRVEENKAFPKDLEPERSITVRRGDVLMSRGNTRELVGSAAWVPEDYPRVMLSDLLYRLVVNDSEYDAEFLAFVLGSRALRDQIELEARGSSQTMPKISQQAVRRLLVPVRTIDEQLRMRQKLRRERLAVAGVLEQSKRLIELATERRSALITAAVTGQIPVGEAA
jgi:type I restriction enzyme S subunit